MKIKELDQHCGNCGVIDYCGNPFGYCLCTDERFLDIEETLYHEIAEKAPGTPCFEECRECSENDCTGCEFDDEAKDQLCNAIADYVYCELSKKLMNEEKTLKYCPYCGSITALEIDGEDEFIQGVGLIRHYQVICSTALKGCGASGGYFATAEEAIAAWNKRTPDVVHCGECERFVEYTFDKYGDIVNYEETLKSKGDCKLFDRTMNCNDYCSFGKRKE